jgi:hypothetical protein
LEITSPVPLCPPQIPHDLTQNKMGQCDGQPAINHLRYGTTNLLSSPWEFTLTQSVILFLLWNVKSHYHVHESLLMDPILKIHSPTTYFFKIFWLIETPDTQYFHLVLFCPLGPFTGGTQ